MISTQSSQQYFNYEHAESLESLQSRVTRSLQSSPLDARASDVYLRYQNTLCQKSRKVQRQRKSIPRSNKSILFKVCCKVSVIYMVFYFWKIYLPSEFVLSRP